MKTKIATKTAGRKLSDLNIPDSGGSALHVGDAPKTLVEDWFAEPFNRKLDDDDKNNFSSAFDILGAEKSSVKDKKTGEVKPTICFLVRSHDDDEKYYFFMGSRPERIALQEAFENDDSPVLNCRFHRFDTGQPQPFVKIVDASDEAEEELF